MLSFILYLEMWLITGPVEIKFKQSKWPLNGNVRLHVDEMATNDIKMGYKYRQGQGLLFKT